MVPTTRDGWADDDESDDDDENEEEDADDLTSFCSATRDFFSGDEPLSLADDTYEFNSTCPNRALRILS